MAELKEQSGQSGFAGCEPRRAYKIIDKLQRVELQEFTNYLHSPWRIFWANFLAGTSRGLGFLLGVGIILTITGFILSKVLSQIPLVGEAFQVANMWIQEMVREAKR